MESAFNGRDFCHLFLNDGTFCLVSHDIIAE